MRSAPRSASRTSRSSWTSTTPRSWRATSRRQLRRFLPGIGHVQIAGVPDRHEPDTGELNTVYLLGLLDELGYEGWVGCEYRPAGRTQDGLRWFETWKTRG